MRRRELLTLAAAPLLAPLVVLLPEMHRGAVTDHTEVCGYEFTGIERGPWRLAVKYTVARQDGCWGPYDYTLKYEWFHSKTGEVTDYARDDA